MSNYGAIPSSTSTAEYQNPATPQLPSTRTASSSRSVSRSHSRDSSNDGLAAAKSNANGDDRGSRNVRFTSPQRRTRFSERTANGTLNGASAEDTNSVADSELSESHAGHAIRARGVNSDGGRGGDDGGDEEGNGEEEDVPAWAAKLRGRLKPTVVLENSGSVARDHLASERTFLAYVRTSLAIASSGVGKSLSAQQYVDWPRRVALFFARVLTRVLRGCSTCTAFHDLSHVEQRHQIELAPAEVRKASGRSRRVHGYRAPARQYVNFVSSSMFFRVVAHAFYAYTHFPPAQ